MRYILLALLTIATITAAGQDKQPVQCEAIKKDKQCTTIAKVTAPDGKHYCNYHNPDKPKCEGTTGSGTRCLHSPVKGGKYCSQHYFQKKA